MKKIRIVLALWLMLLPFGMAVQAGDLPPIPLTTAYTRLAGDANKDSSLDLQDVALISRYLAGGYGVTIVAENADVNGDKVVDLKDVVLLCRYLAHWDVTLQ